MDRFIEHILAYNNTVVLTLKSNMDRFIEVFEYPLTITKSL